MADLKKLADDLTTRAALDAGKSAAKRAVEDLLSSDEERAQKDAERAKTSKSRRNKFLLYGVLALCLLIGVIGLLISYWQWFLALGVLGIVGLYAWWRLRHRLASKPEEPLEEAEPARAAKARTIDTGRSTDETRHAAEEAQRKQAEARKRDAEATREAIAANEQAVDDELAALKARLKK